MKTNIPPLQPNTFYHVYNRGVNGENLFKEERNYSFFLEKYDKYLSPYVDTYAYCLLKNHFHLLICTKSEIRILETMKRFAYKEHSSGSFSNPDVSKMISHAFASLFKSYAQAINKAYGRTGALFEEPFRRIEVKAESYFSQLIHYIHFNPQKHGLAEDFSTYPHSSYHAFVSMKTTKVKREQVLEWLGNRLKFIEIHAVHSAFKDIKEMIIDE